MQKTQEQEAGPTQEQVAEPVTTGDTSVEERQVNTVTRKPSPRKVHFLSRPVLFALWAHMHRFLSVCLSLENNSLEKNS